MLYYEEFCLRTVASTSIEFFSNDGSVLFLVKVYQMSILLHHFFTFLLLGSLWSIPAVAANVQEYIIFPRDTITRQENIALHDVILRSAADGRVYSEPKRGNSGITMFWTAVLSEAAFRLLKAYPLV